MKETLLKYVLHLADNELIHGHRLSEWCGHAPNLEIDIAMSNLALDNIGTARSLYQYAASIEGNGKTEDSYPYLRDERDFYNFLLVEQPRGDFAETIARCFYYDAYQVHFYTELQKSTDTHLAAIAEKSLKEVAYHLRFSSGWIARLGDGTDESKEKMQHALNKYKPYCDEMFHLVFELDLINSGVAPDVSQLQELWEKTISETIHEATLSYPLNVEKNPFFLNGKNGIHTEHLGFILAQMQYLQRTNPQATW
ncbi:MAG: phenylacetate-CoA oxygenase subunit PaaC [Chitinophagaceae bacterium]|nr:MAG: phenylacetate-CoA oxygenase subunit PaaI [Bacteroidetes bacterium OLB11]MCC6447877.1 phenylacetate-CoA oxygenase subunit PaaC [Chitinophagaceae bacterium]HMN33659.1 phenylacetate-CoA oxygenase subunit PaaC [Chitinophagaceae bacterium]